ncbi:YggS family pyridoxal phosphate-dependent enzyme [Aeromicrobium sp.]|uniref:YggS family pyridoxal phosphate-dependent enzyme n=1 Tax=Aeromicrobium sp. TaxID=1871063 RepID=UPI0019C0F4F9|nr:YggS family pyridoxal phosphate-dependent enzyme [Aeromicrobium sp.]MBC7632630.1 YggS family pyridoxal phosphate-dependent enzyme [Aeromicrobium sp.]
MSRRDDIAAGLAETEQRIVSACETAGRPRDDITLVVVTKTHPASDVEILADLGVVDVGENRHPEAGDKAAEVDRPLRWHFLGALQTNKAGAVARYADVVHSVDRAKLAHSLARGAEAAGRTLTCLIQVDFDATDPGRAGVVPAGIPDLASAIADAGSLVLGGLMTVAPLGDDPTPHFEHLRRLSEELRADRPDASILSAGMSGDFEQAIAAGATHLRIGRSILGTRGSTG